MNQYCEIFIIHCLEIGGPVMFYNLGKPMVNVVNR